MLLKKTSVALVLSVLVLLSFGFEINLVDANLADPLPHIYIKEDGSFEPKTAPIQRNGNTYSLTRDMNGTQIVIECSNIVFDGNGHSINLMDSGSNPGIHISYSVNTTIKNVQVNTPIYTSIAMYDCSDCHITGVKSSGYIELRQSIYNIICENISPLFLKSEYNQIFRNNITGLALWAGSNVFYQNNILLDSGYTPYADEANFWDNSSIGNYWSDYATRYPNASEIGQTGIGDTPYMLDSDNIDHYPVLYPFNIENGNVASPSREPPSKLFSFPNSVVFFAVGVSIVFIIAVVAVGLLYRRSHRKVSVKQTGDLKID